MHKSSCGLLLMSAFCTTRRTQLYLLDLHIGAVASLQPLSVPFATRVNALRPIALAVTANRRLVVVLYEDEYYGCGFVEALFARKDDSNR